MGEALRTEKRYAVGFTKHTFGLSTQSRKLDSNDCLMTGRFVDYCLPTYTRHLDQCQALE